MRTSYYRDQLTPRLWLSRYNYINISESLHHNEEAQLRIKYPLATITFEISSISSRTGHIAVLFHDDADEAEFMLKESL